MKKTDIILGGRRFPVYKENRVDVYNDYIPLGYNWITTFADTRYSYFKYLKLVNNKPLSIPISIFYEVRKKEIFYIDMKDITP